MTTIIRTWELADLQGAPVFTSRSGRYVSKLMSAEEFDAVELKEHATDESESELTIKCPGNSWFTNPLSRSSHDFKNIMSYLNEVHTVLPYASEQPACVGAHIALA